MRLERRGESGLAAGGVWALARSHVFTYLSKLSSEIIVQEEPVIRAGALQLSDYKIVVTKERDACESTNQVGVGMTMDLENVRWDWDQDKNDANRNKRGLDFETAIHVFGDPLAVTFADPHRGDKRWRTVGTVRDVVLVVIHTWEEDDSISNDVIVRIISARKAERHERQAYEQGHY